MSLDENGPENLPPDTDSPAEEEEDFASMLEGSLEPRALQQGETVEGSVIAVRKDVVFVDVGAKGEATIDLEELRNPDGEIEVQVGDIVQAIVVSTAGGLRLSCKLARGAASRRQLAEAFRAGVPVEGRVEKVIKGGFEVRVAGQRAFCPISQIDKAFTEDPSVHEGQVYTFRVTEYKDDGKDLVVSRRALLEEEERERAEEVRRTIVVGAVLPGRVVSVRPYGAFVDLGGGIQGLLHVSEISWSRVSDPAEVVRPGDELQVKILGVDDEKGKISLGLKQLQADPWTNAQDTYEVGQYLSGRLTRIADFGAFVELEPGIEALAHESTFPPTGKRDGWKSSVQPGDSVAVEVLSVEFERKRIGVAIVEEGSTRAQRAHDESDETQQARPAASSLPQRVAIVPGARLQGKVERHESYGVFVFLAPGRTGLIPLAETGVDRGTDLRKRFPVGSALEVMVLEVEPSGRRIGLSRKAIGEADEKTEVRDYAERQSHEQPEGFGSLADKLRAAIKPPKD